MKNFWFNKKRIILSFFLLVSLYLCQTTAHTVEVPANLQTTLSIDIVTELLNSLLQCYAIKGLENTNPLFIRKTSIIACLGNLLNLSKELSIGMKVLPPLWETREIVPNSSILAKTTLSSVCNAYLASKNGFRIADRKKIATANNHFVNQKHTHSLEQPAPNISWRQKKQYIALLLSTLIKVVPLALLWRECSKSKIYDYKNEPYLHISEKDILVACAFNILGNFVEVFRHWCIPYSTHTFEATLILKALGITTKPVDQDVTPVAMPSPEKEE